MGSSYSCFGVPGQSGRNLFTWKIDGFTSLLEKGEGSTNTPFDMEGIRWQLSLNPQDKKSADPSSKHVSVGISVSPFSLRPSYMLQARFRIFIYDQKYGRHSIREVGHTYQTTCRTMEVSCMVPLQKLENPSFGFLVNNTIAVGVELINLKKVACNGIERSTFIPKNIISGSHSWYIDDFSQLKKPTAYSEPFEIGGYTWRLKLQPEGKLNKNYVSMYLELDKSRSQHLPSDGVLVEFVLSIKKQAARAYRGKSRFIFSTKATGWGYAEFIKIEEFLDPTNGYLIKGTCTFEAKVNIFGFATDRA
ncbi:TRAF-like family protein [Rhynchospora pubera]|uniref:TRAF-like family protein n=1 Tax=Rhynchospora pubera TaxID=906938 RepID=A0AAV8F035_9POAL|nr:TRAF-like family protein [Rhynchospora pubera]